MKIVSKKKNATKDFWSMYAEVKLQTPPPMWLAKAQPIEPLAKKPIAQVLLNKQNVTDEEITLLFQTES